jgi:hypothetical protein
MQGQSFRTLKAEQFNAAPQAGGPQLPSLVGIGVYLLREMIGFAAQHLVGRWKTENPIKTVARS